MKQPVSPVLFSATQRFRAVLHALRARGINVDEALSAVGMTESQLLDPNTRVPREVSVRLSQLLVRAARNEPAPALQAATYFKLTDLGLVGYMIRHSEHVLGALQRLARYSRLVADAAECCVHYKNDHVVFRAGLTGGRTLTPHGVDYAMATIVCGLRELTEPAIQPLVVRLAREAPSSPKHYHALFGVRVEFAAPHSELVLDQRAVLRPLLTHDAQLLSILEQQAQSAIAALPTPASFVQQVRDLIATRLGSAAHGAEHLAAELGVSERTLRRRLSESGIDYRALLDHVRRERALTLIANDQLSIMELAQNVGFSDPSAFASAFRRWTGQTPRTARRHLARARAEPPMLEPAATRS